jgi:hypothetical protein
MFVGRCPAVILQDQMGMRNEGSGASSEPTMTPPTMMNVVFLADALKPVKFSSIYTED